MRIVIDLQGAQSASRFRGIGRYSLALALGVARNAQRDEHGHEVWLLMNAALPDSIDALRLAFAPYVPAARMRVFDSATPCAEHHAPQQWRSRVNEKVREHVLDQLQPDMVLVTSLFEGYVDDSVVSVGTWRDGGDTAVVLYDLIPFLNPAAYLPTPVLQDYYGRKIASLRKAGLLLSISDYSRSEALDALRLEPERIVSISTAVDECFHPAALGPEASQALRARFGIARDYVMCAPGGFDRRKNIDGLIGAWALLDPALRARYQLVIASKLDQGEHARLLEHAARAGVTPDELLWTDYVEDEVLIDLYRDCALFVFPSRHEGFGLPALEAMACGAPVIGGDNTSIPEVIGAPEALFDADSPQAIAERMGAVLADPAVRQRLLDNGRARAPLFSWDASAVRALRAMEAHHARRHAATPAAPTARRRKLAFVSPLPPERTGIADYAAQCLPALREHFELTLITHQDTVALAPESMDIPRQDAAWFADHAGEFDQIIYQFGNSPFHSHMFGLLERFPGVVVLHDFFLSSVLAYEQMTGAMPGAFSGALLHSHGYAALQEALAPEGAERAKLAYPCNLAVLQGASEIIVHSSHALQLARQWYGAAAGANWHVVPLPRSAPPAQDRAAARRALGIRDEAFLVCSFGFVDASKLSHRLLEAFRASSLCAQPECELVFVGANHGGAYGKELLDAIAAAGVQGRIRIAGWTEEEQYRQYLQAADVGVQLRSISRGETSAAVLDCMNYGLPTIVNANGSMAALADDAVWKLADDFDSADLSTALDTLYRDPARRGELGVRAAARIAGEHRPEHAATRYAQVLDAAWARSPRDSAALVAALAGLTPRDDAPLQQVASVLARAVLPQPLPRQLLVDVTNIVRNDLGTGIERVVRMQLIELLRARLDLRVEPVYLSEQGGRWHYRYAPRYACSVLGLGDSSTPDTALDVAPGDLLYAPDYAPHATCEAARAGVYADLRAHGVSLNFLIHDLLPVLRPEFFPPGADAPHAAWLACIAGEADRLICISQAVADETQAWLGERVQQAPRYTLHVLHHGADFAPATDTPGAVLPQAISAAPSFLMVGTIEPRKGHLQALDAFEALWRDGVEANLVIVGKEGWTPLADLERRTIPQIVARLANHPQAGKRLFWMKGVDDATLLQLYRDCACLLAPSEGEGFGLPLIEAAHHGLPIVARDIPVFREVAGAAAFYFDGTDGAALAARLRDWLALHAAGGHPASNGIAARSWRDNAADLVAILSGAAG